jgi:hypothetical protein
LFGDFWQNFGLNFPFFGADRAGGLFGGTFRPEEQQVQLAQQQGGFPNAPGVPGAPGASQLPAGAPGVPGAPGGGGGTKPASAVTAEPPMGPVSSPLAPGGMAGGVLGTAPVAPGQEQQPDRLGGGGDRLAELLRQYNPGGVRAS